MSCVLSGPAPCWPDLGNRKLCAQQAGQAACTPGFLRRGAHTRDWGKDPLPRAQDLTSRVNGPWSPRAGAGGVRQAECGICLGLAPRACRGSSEVGGRGSQAEWVIRDSSFGCWVLDPKCGHLPPAKVAGLGAPWVVVGKLQDGASLGCLVRWTFAFPPPACGRHQQGLLEPWAQFPQDSGRIWRPASPLLFALED